MELFLLRVYTDHYKYTRRPSLLVIKILTPGKVQINGKKSSSIYFPLNKTDRYIYLEEAIGQWGWGVVKIWEEPLDGVVGGPRGA